VDAGRCTVVTLKCEEKMLEDDRRGLSDDRKMLGMKPLEILYSSLTN
jgi:hypothetical protein